MAPPMDVEEFAVRRRDQQVWLWDGLLWTQKDGFGKYPSRDFNKLAKAAKV